MRRARTAGICATWDGVTVQSHGKPRVVLDFSRSRYPAAGQDPFQPLRLPDRCAVTVQGPVQRALRRGLMSFSLRLRPGVYSLPLSRGPACRVEVPEGCTLEGRVDIGPDPRAGDSPLVQALELRFSRPLVIRNVLSTLGQVQRLVADRTLAPLRQLLGSRVSPMLPSWLAPLTGMALLSADEAGDVLLDRASARPRWRRDGTAALSFAFTGSVRWADRLETRFSRVTLPSQVLPEPHAALDQLLSAEPLASADVTEHALDGAALLHALLEMADDVSGEATLSLVPPPLCLRSTTIDGTRLSGELAQQTPVVLSAGLKATVEESDIVLVADRVRLHPTGDRRDTLELDLRARVSLDLVTRGLAPEDRLRADAQLTIRPGSRWTGARITARLEEAIATGEAAAVLDLTDMETDGAFALSLAPGELRLEPIAPLRLLSALEAKLAPRPAAAADPPASESGTLVRGTVRGSLEPITEEEWRARARVEAAVESRLETGRVMTLPELDIQQGLLTGLAAGGVELDLLAALRFPDGSGPHADLAGTAFSLQLDSAEGRLEGRRVTLPAGTRVSGRVQRGVLTPAGPEDVAVELRWDLGGQRCLLHHHGHTTSLLTPDLRAGELVLHLERTGRLRFSGDRGGLYGVRYFNLLLNPSGDPDHLVDLLLSDDALARVISAIGAFTPRLAEALTDLRALGLTAREILRREGISEPRHVIPRRSIARLFSLLLCGDESLQPRLEPIIQRVTEGHGLDMLEVKTLLQQQLGEFDIDYELSALLGWLNLVLSPSEPMPPPLPVAAPPLVLDPRFEEARRSLPSAAEVYAAVDAGALSAEWTARLAELCPRLNRRQLDHVLERAAPTWDPELVTRLRYVRSVKLRVEAIGEQYGGAEFALQPTLVASFLGEAVGPLPGVNCLAGSGGKDAWPPPCALGPTEVAVLLQAGQSSGMEGKRAQVNNRLLLELLRSKPPEFTLAALVELGNQSPRALAGFLYSFLDQDQDHMRRPLDLGALLSEKLGMELPVQRHYMAGGRRAAESYYQALCDVADRIILDGSACLARKQHLQTMRHPVPPELVVPPTLDRLERLAREAIMRADELGALCRFDDPRRGGPRARTRQGYQVAFRACARLLEREPRAFHLPWFRQFWLRNEEALTVLSVVRGHQEDREDDRRWLRVQSGRDAPDSEQELLDLVIDTLYLRPEHRRAMAADPLVRLLIDPDPGELDFTIISAMGVITEGAEGRELEQAYARLEQRRGVRLARPATATARSLEYNAARIIEAIEECPTPYGVIGYSQGCANVLRAESLLLGSTPARQRLLDRLVCRNLLFSAANGSAHGSSGMLKFQRAMVLGEKYLKHYQALLSWEAVKAMLRATRATLDSRMFIHILGGVHSLTYERALDLHRDEQFLDRVPTSYVRGVVPPDRLPETLEFLYHVLCVIAGTDQDTQVMITDAVGHSTRVKNHFTTVLERCDMGAYPQITHHWAPLTHEIEMVTTERDRELAIYQSPKDRLVWPWVEVNARFGLIKPR